MLGIKYQTNEKVEVDLNKIQRVAPSWNITLFIKSIFLNFDRDINLMVDTISNLDANVNTNFLKKKKITFKLLNKMRNWESAS